MAGNGAILIRIGAGDRVTVVNTEGGQRVELVAVPGLGHQWAREADINTRIWTFMALQTLNAPR